MARPIKSGVDYWPLDVGFFEDKKLRLIKGEYGAMGTLIALTLINEVYRTDGYYKVWDSDDAILTAELIGCGCDAKTVGKVVDACCERGLFDKGLFIRFGILTSRGIQRRYIRIVGAKRSRLHIIEEYWLLDNANEDDVPAVTSLNIRLRSVFDAETVVSEPETPVFSAGNTTKKSKEKKIKEKKTKGNQIKEEKTACAGEASPCCDDCDDDSDDSGELSELDRVNIALERVADVISPLTAEFIRSTVRKGG